MKVGSTHAVDLGGDGHCGGGVGDLLPLAVAQQVLPVGEDQARLCGPQQVVDLGEAAIAVG